MRNAKTKMAAALVAAAATMAAGTAVPAQAMTGHRVVFRSWGTPYRAMVSVDGNTSIDRMRVLPWQQTQYMSGYKLEYANITVEDVNGYRRVGCSITKDGRIVARDVSSFGYAWCMMP
jgi:hypothetical protein